MRKEKILIKMLRDIADLLNDESARNPQFANQLGLIISEITKQDDTKRRPSKAKVNGQIPDIHSEWSTRGELEFRLWLRDQPIEILKSIIKQQGFDPTYKTQKWKEAEKLSDFITNGLLARLSKGSAFISKPN